MVNKRADIPFFTKVIGGVVIMGGVQAEVLDKELRMDGLKFAE